MKYVENPIDVLDAVSLVEKPLVRGFVRLAVLIVLKKSSEYSYRIYKVLKGELSLSTLYTVLKELEERGLVRRDGDRYSITELGLRVLSTLLTRYGKLIEVLESLIAGRNGS